MPAMVDSVITAGLVLSVRRSVIGMTVADLNSTANGTANIPIGAIGSGTSTRMTDTQPRKHAVLAKTSLADESRTRGGVDRVHMSNEASSLMRADDCRDMKQVHLVYA